MEQERQRGKGPSVILPPLASRTPSSSVPLALSLLIPPLPPLENCTAIMRYIYGMCPAPSSLPHVEHIREEEVMQSFEVGLGVRGRSGSPSRFSTLSMVCKGQAIRDIWNIFETYGTFWRRIKDIHMDPAELRDKAKNMHMSFFLI